MKKQILIFLTFGILSMTCNGQVERLETKLMNCFYENFEDKGTKFKKSLSDFEKLLIAEKILANGTGKSYKGIFEKIIVDDDFDYNPSESFFDNIIDIGLPKGESYKNCLAEQRKRTKIEFKKGIELHAVLDSIISSENLTPAKVANGILSVLDEKDFELDYYKMTVFFLFDTISYSIEDDKKSLEFKQEMSQYDLSKAINIYLDKSSQIFVNNKKVDIEQLKIQIREYEFKNKSESIIFLKAERETIYKTYVDVQNAIVGEIRDLRKQLAKETYHTELDSLTEVQLSIIKKVYPQRIIEQ